MRITDNNQTTYKRDNYLKEFEKRQTYYKMYYQQNKDKYKQIYNENKQQVREANKQKTIKNNIVEVVIV